MNVDRRRHRPDREDCNGSTHRIQRLRGWGPGSRGDSSRVPSHGWRPHLSTVAKAFRRSVSTHHCHDAPSRRRHAMHGQLRRQSQARVARNRRRDWCATRGGGGIGGGVVNNAVGQDSIKEPQLCSASILPLSGCRRRYRARWCVILLSDVVAVALLCCGRVCRRRRRLDVEVCHCDAYNQRVV